MSDALAPIALFAYNRPRHVAQTVAALLRNPLAAASDLHIFCDGPKTPAVADAVREVRAFVRSITGFRSVSIVEQDRNIGLANSVIAGVTSLCSRFGRVIVVEDDLFVAPCFLAFMNAGLERYQGDEQVMQIAGHMFATDRRFQSRAVFLPFICSWGWASWQRAWQHFDPQATGYAALRRSPWLRRQFDLDGAYHYFAMLERQLRGEIDSWAIRWYLSCFMRRGLALYPGTTLVHNAGFDGSGTHTKGNAGDAVRGGLLDANGDGLPGADKIFTFPSETVVDTDAMADVKRALRNRQRPVALSRWITGLWRKARVLQAGCGT